MTTLRSYIDQNQQGPIVAASIMSEKNQHEVRCGMCAREIYVDDEHYHLYMDRLKADSDNPFRCETCEDYDDSSVAFLV